MSNLKFYPPIMMLAFSVVFTACQREPLPAPEYVEYLPAEEDDLGKVLFYDKQLSLNNSISCASCHKQELAFADDVPFSTGFDNRVTTRNSMPIQNLEFGFIEGRTMPFSVNQDLFWDGREENLTDMVIMPIVNHIEMGISDIQGLCDKLESLPYYNRLFTETYGNAEVTPRKIAMALHNFVGRIRSDNTRFDQYLRGEVDLTPSEKNGQRLFLNVYNCNSCHRVTQPNGYQQAGTFANIGLDAVDPDPGRGGVTKAPQDMGKFKIPSLRNVAHTAPYMHDGRYKTLEDVLDHYTNKIAENKNLDFRLRTEDGSILRQPITQQEKDDIIAFMITLSDETMMHDENLASPFKVKPL